MISLGLYGHIGEDEKGDAQEKTEQENYQDLYILCQKIPSILQKGTKGILKEGLS